jgi:hypothetical protein
MVLSTRVLDSDWPLRKISEPHEANDVILDQVSLGAYNFPLQGNKRLLELVESRREEYSSRSRMEKPVVAVEILKEWRSQDPPGRFLVVEEGSRPPLWSDVGDKRARNYISKILKGKVAQAHEMDGGCLFGNTSNETSMQGAATGPQHQRPELNWKSIANKLYEREEQAGKLLKAFERSRHPDASKHPELVLICGPSGSGKQYIRWVCMHERGGV